MDSNNRTGNIMIVNKIFNTEKKCYVPDLSGVDTNMFEVNSIKLNQDGNTYTISLNWVYPCPQTITPAQGRIMLSRLGKLEDIENTIEHMDKESQIFWEYALTWNRSNSIVIQLSNQFGFDIDNLFIEASKIE
jgi:hypothetical protein